MDKFERGVAALHNYHFLSLYKQSEKISIMCNWRDSNATGGATAIGFSATAKA